MMDHNGGTCGTPESPFWTLVLKAINIPPTEALSYCFQLCMASSAGLVRKLETYPVCIHPEIIGIDIQHEWMDGWIDRWMQNCLDVLFVLGPKQIICIIRSLKTPTNTPVLLC